MRPSLCSVSTKAFDKGLTTLHLQYDADYDQLSRNSQTRLHLFAVICSFPMLPPSISPPSFNARVAKALTRRTKHCQDRVGLFCFPESRLKKKCCHGFGTLAKRWEAGLSLWITSVSAGLWCALTAPDNFYKLKEHMLPLCVWIGSHGQDTDSTGKCICRAWALQLFPEEKTAIAT